MSNLIFFILIFSIKYLFCSGYNIGLFRKNDFLIAQDVVYKERRPNGIMYARYGRIFKCPISYIQVADKLGLGRGPRVEILRGGLRKKYVVLRMTSNFNQPIAVNVYIGCENHMKPATRAPTKAPHHSTAAPGGGGGHINTTPSGGNDDKGKTDGGDDGDNTTTNAPGGGDGGGGGGGDGDGGGGGGGGGDADGGGGGGGEAAEKK